MGRKGVGDCCTGTSPEAAFSSPCCECRRAEGEAAHAARAPVLRVAAAVASTMVVASSMAAVSSMAAGVPSAAAVAVLARPTVLGTSVAVAVWGAAVRVAPRLAFARECQRRRPLRQRSSIPVMGVGRIVHARLRGPSLGRRCPQRGWSSSRSRRGRRKLVDLLFASFWAGFRRGHLLSESGLAMNFSCSSNSAIISRVA